LYKLTGADYLEKTAYIILKRYSKWVYRARKFDIIIDNQKVDSIGNGKEKTIPLTPGQHTIELRVSWIIKSQIQTVTVAPGESILLTCGCPMPIWPFLLLGGGGWLLFSKLLILLGVIFKLIFLVVFILASLGWGIYIFTGRGRCLELLPPERNN
jgi:hypothetical protein